jgi:succinyl-CoA synthetase beta subunit
MGQVQVEGIRMKEPQVDGEFLFKSLALVGKRGKAGGGHMAKSCGPSQRLNCCADSTRAVGEAVTS